MSQRRYTTVSGPHRIREPEEKSPPKENPTGILVPRVNPPDATRFFAAKPCFFRVSEEDCTLHMLSLRDTHRVRMAVDCVTKGLSRAFPEEGAKNLMEREMLDIWRVAELCEVLEIELDNMVDFGIAPIDTSESQDVK